MALSREEFQLVLNIEGPKGPGEEGGTNAGRCGTDPECILRLSVADEEAESSNTERHWPGDGLNGLNGRFRASMAVRLVPTPFDGNRDGIVPALARLAVDCDEDAPWLSCSGLRFGCSSVGDSGMFSRSGVE